MKEKLLPLKSVNSVVILKSVKSGAREKDTM